MLGDKTRVDSIPVYIIFIPVFIILMTKQCGKHRSVTVCRHHQQPVALIQHGFRSRNAHIAGTPQTRNHEFMRSQRRHLPYAHTVNAGVFHLKSSDKRMIGISMVCHIYIRLTNNKFPHQCKSDYHSHHSKRISDRTAQSCPCRWKA